MSKTAALCTTARVARCAVMNLAMTSKETRAFVTPARTSRECETMGVYRIDGKKALETHDRSNPDRDRIVEARATEDGDIMVKVEVE